MTTPHSDPALTSAVGALVTSGAADTVRLDVTRSPDAVEVAGRALAARLARYEPEILFTWSQPDDAILAHIVARELGLRAVLFGVYEGVISTDVSLIRDRRVGLVVTQLSPTDDYDVLARFLANNGASLVVVAEVLRAADHARPAGAHVALTEPNQIRVS